jgi:hypothetical protein
VDCSQKPRLLTGEEKFGFENWEDPEDRNQLEILSLAADHGMIHQDKWSNVHVTNICASKDNCWLFTGDNKGKLGKWNIDGQFLDSIAPVGERKDIKEIFAGI